MSGKHNSILQLINKLNPAVIAFTSIIAIVISIIGLLVSFNISKNALKISKESNKIAQEALESAKNFFISENRPYIILEPKRLKDPEFFLKIIYDDKKITIKNCYSMKNVGNTCAKNISVPENMAVSAKLEKGAPIEVYLPPKITLGPRQEHDITCSVTLFMEEGIKETIDRYNSGEFVITLQMVVFYTSELDSNKKYKTKVEHKIYKDRAVLIKSEMD